MSRSEQNKDECVVRVDAGPAPDGTYDGTILKSVGNKVGKVGVTKVVLYGPTPPEIGKVYHGYLHSGFAMIHPVPPVETLKLSRGRKRTA